MAAVDHIDVSPGLIYVDRPGYYFGYGLESDPQIMEAILGRPKGAPALVYELGVVAINKRLVVQEIDQIPAVATDAWAGQSAQQLLANAWTKHTTKPFSAYALRDSENRSDIVGGTLYKLFREDALALNEWDLANANIGEATWRYWDHTVELVDGRQVSTLTIGSLEEVDRTVDGTAYNPYLNDRSVVLQVIHDFQEGR